MITRLEDYKFVTGDIGEMKIDGSIMPLRSGTQALRGEDICFLLEMVRERTQAITRSLVPVSIDTITISPRAFTKTLSSAQMNYIRSSTIDLQQYGKFIRDISALPSTATNIGEVTDIAEAFPLAFYQPTNILSTNVIVNSGDPLRLLPVMSRFLDMRKLARFLDSGDFEFVSTMPSSGVGNLLSNYVAGTQETATEYHLVQRGYHSWATISSSDPIWGVFAVSWWSPGSQSRDSTKVVARVDMSSSNPALLASAIASAAGIPSGYAYQILGGTTCCRVWNLTNHTVWQ